MQDKTVAVRSMVEDVRDEKRGFPVGGGAWGQGARQGGGTAESVRTRDLSTGKRSSEY